MDAPGKRPGRYESLRGLLAPLAAIVVGFVGALRFGRPAAESPPPPQAPHPASAMPSGVLPVRTAVATAPHAASYRGDMGLTGVFDSPCPTAPVAVRWRYATAGTPAGGLVWDGMRFLVALAEGTVLALDSDGRELWRRDAALEGIAAPPVADGSRCFVISPKGTLAAFRSSDGEPLWRTEAPMGFRARNGPILASDGLIAVSQDDGRLLALDPQDGTIRWTGKPAARSDGPISVGASAVLLGNCDAAVRFHATGTGELVGAVPLGDDAQVAGAVAVRGTRAVCGTRTGDVVMLDTAAQTVLWRAPTDGGEVFSAPVLTDDLVVVTTMAAEAIAFAAADGRELWRYRSEIRSATSPILVDGRVVLATAGIVVALDASGAVLWRISVGDATTEPCAGAGLIVVGTAEGDIVAVGPRD